MEITIYCNECKEKTPHTLEAIRTDIYNDNPTKWMCNKCKIAFYEGELYFNGKEYTKTLNRNTKQFLLNRLNK